MKAEVLVSVQKKLTLFPFESGFAYRPYLKSAEARQTYNAKWTDITLLKIFSCSKLKVR